MRFFLFFVCAILVSGVTPAVAGLKPPITIPEKFRTCTQDSDCILVDTLCSACCGYDAINAANKNLFSELQKNYCANHNGAVCDCIAPGVEPVCKENRCTAFNPFADEKGNASYE